MLSVSQCMARCYPLCFRRVYPLIQSIAFHGMIISLEDTLLRRLSKPRQVFRTRSRGFGHTANVGREISRMYQNEVGLYRTQYYSYWVRP